MTNWSLFVVGAIRTALYVVMFLIAVFVPGRLSDVAARRGLVIAAATVGFASSTIFTLTNSGVLEPTSLRLAVGSVLSGLVVALWTAIIITCAWGLRPWEPR